MKIIRGEITYDTDTATVMYEEDQFGTGDTRYCVTPCGRYFLWRRDKTYLCIGGTPEELQVMWGGEAIRDQHVSKVSQEHPEWDYANTYQRIYPMTPMKVAESLVEDDMFCQGNEYGKSRVLDKPSFKTLLEQPGVVDEFLTVEDWEDPVGDVLHFYGVKVE